MTNKKLSILSVLLLCAGFVNAQAKFIEKVSKKGNEIVIPYEKYQLPNGLTIVVHEDHSDPIVHVDVTYHVGSAREEIGKSGFAHFFEHMMFEGSDHVGKGEHFKIITDAGGSLNGSTNRDRTNYYETVPSNQLEKMIWLEADRMGYLLDAVTQEKFENQRSTVKNERGQNYDNRPYGLAGETSSKNLYPYGHPYSWLTIGYVEDLNRVTVNDLKNFFLRWYGPNNATLTVGGDVKTADVIKLAEKYFGNIPPGPKVEKTVLAPVRISSDRYVSYVDNYAKLPQLEKTFPTVPNYDADMAPLACLAQVLGQGKNSVMYQELVKTKKALAANAYSSLTELAGEFDFTIRPYPGTSLAAADSMLANVLSAFEKRGVTDDDIAKFKGGIEAQYINGLQSVSGKVSQLAAFQTFTGNPNMIGKMLNRYLAVTKDDVMRVYNKYIKNKHGVTLSVLTKKDSTPARPDNYSIDTSKYVHPDYGYAGLKYVKGKDSFDRTKVPGNGANPVVNVPPFWKKQEANGISFIGTQNTEIPVVNVLITIPGGHLTKGIDVSKTGLAPMVADMLTEDTKNYTAEQLAYELEKLGSRISVSSDLDNISFSLQCLKKNLDKSLALLEERMFRPKFTEDAFDRNKKQTLESFKQYRATARLIASAVFDKINYGSGIWGMREEGTEATVNNLALSDVENYYNNYMTSRGTKVVVVGDVTENEIYPKLKFLNNLPDKKVELITDPGNTPAITSSKIYLVDVPNAAQTEFRVGYLTHLKYDATGEFYKSGVMNYTLGGGFNSILNMNLREERGWTYGARSSFSGNEYDGSFLFSSGIRSNATDSALVDLMNDIKNYVTDGISDDQLVFTKNAIGQRDALAYETGTQKASFIKRLLDYDLPSNYVSQQNQILSGLTKEEINQLAKKWLTYDKFNILLVGDKASILPGLQKLGYEIIELDVEGNKK